MVGKDPPFFVKNSMNTPRTEFAQALKAIATERGLDPEVIIAAIKEAIEAAYKRDARERGEEVEELVYEVQINPVNGETKILFEGKDVTPPGFGRIAAQTAKQVIHQKIREAEKGAMITEFEQRVGNLISGMILRFDGSSVRVDIGKTTEAIMPAEERVPNERLNPNQRLTFLLKAIEDGPRGKQIILSRADPEFVSKLFAREVPEIGSNSVEIKLIARDAGIRTKIAVASSQQGVDPVGSCVGQKGVRVQAVTNELNGERIDIISWTEKEEDLIKASLSPVEVVSLKLNKKAKEAVVKVAEDQLPLAIGRDGQNVRLASRLTGWKIDIEGVASKVKKEDEKVEKASKVKEVEVKEVKEEKIEKVEEKKEEVVEEKAPEVEEVKTDEKSIDEKVVEKEQ